MHTTQISHARQSQIAAAFRAGRQAAKNFKGELLVSAQVRNPFSERGMMPENLATVRAAQWHAFMAGVDREMGDVPGAGTILRNARFCMRRATELGRA